MGLFQPVIVPYTSREFVVAPPMSSCRAYTGQGLGADVIHFGGLVGVGAYSNDNSLDEWSLCPFFLEVGQTIVDFGVENTAAGVGNARAALYSNRGRRDYYPHVVLIDTGDIDTNVGAGFQSVAVNFRVPETDLYWGAVNQSAAAPNLRGIANVRGWVNILGTNTTGGTFIGATLALAFGAPPSPFPAGATRSSQGAWACVAFTLS